MWHWIVSMNAAQEAFLFGNGGSLEHDMDERLAEELPGGAEAA